MGIPQTLSGIVGILIFVIFIVSISASDVYPDQTKQVTDAQNFFIYNLNNSFNSTSTQSAGSFWGSIFGIVGLDGIYNSILNFFGMIVSFMIMVVGYILLFFGIAVSLPPEFYVFFALLGSGLIIAIVKLIFLSGD